MKKLFFVLFMVLSVGAFAQLNDGDMSRYLAKDAVVVKDGYVVFTDKMQLVGNCDVEKIGQVALSWMEGFLSEYEPSKNRVLSNEPGKIVGMGDMQIVFVQNALAFDRAQMSYAMTLEYTDKMCSLSVERIRYVYDDGTQVSKITAEEYIVDQMAVNKKGTRLTPVTGKFRKKTIDAVDEIFSSFEQAFKYYTANGIEEVVKNAPQMMQAQQAAPVQQAQPVQAAAPVHPIRAAAPAKPVQKAEVVAEVNAASVAENSAMQGFRKIAPEEIPGNIIQKVSKEWMLITAGNKEKFNMMTASWGGLGVLYSKPVAICFINPARYTYQVMEESNGTYTLTFYGQEHKDALKYCGTKSGRDEDKVKGSGLTPVQVGEGAMAFREAVLVIECRKLVSQSISLDAINNVQERNSRASQPMHKMYIGEIINVWVKE